jgi:ATP-dependent exoDNAse (exonuclease V) alpha subunit
MSDIPVALELDHPILFGTKAEATLHNERQIAAIRSKSFYSNAKVLVGERVKAIRWFENHTRAMQRFHFKRGMRVMCIQNHSLGGRVIVANGDLGTIVGVGPASDDGLPEFLRVTFDRFGGTLPISRYEFKKTIFVRGQERTVFKVKQFPFVPAYALTVHKAQGLTLDVANVDGARITFAAGQVYVAVSRCRTKGGLRIRNANGFNAFTRPQVEEYYGNARRFQLKSGDGKNVAGKPSRRSFWRRLWEAFFPRDGV